MLLAAFSMLKGKVNAPVGSITGLVGVGGGFLIVPALLAFTLPKIKLQGFLPY